MVEERLHPMPDVYQVISDCSEQLKTSGRKMTVYEGARRYNICVCDMLSVVREIMLLHPDWKLEFVSPSPRKVVE